jgi:hypothetical protein
MAGARATVLLTVRTVPDPVFYLERLGSTARTYGLVWRVPELVRVDAVRWLLCIKA